MVWPRCAPPCGTARGRTHERHRARAGRCCPDDRRQRVDEQSLPEPTPAKRLIERQLREEVAGDRPVALEARASRQVPVRDVVQHDCEVGDDTRIVQPHVGPRLARGLRTERFMTEVSSERVFTTLKGGDVVPLAQGDERVRPHTAERVLLASTMARSFGAGSGETTCIALKVFAGTNVTVSPRVARRRRETCLVMVATIRLRLRGAIPRRTCRWRS